MILNNRQRRRRGWSIAFRTFLAVLIPIALGLQALAELDIWKTPPPWLLLSSILLVALSSLRDNISMAVRKVKSPERQERRESTHKAVVGALAQIARHRQVDIFALGVSVFFINEGARWLPTSIRERWAWSRPYLDRTVRFRLEDSPQPSDVLWSKGKGTIGQCWEHDKPRHTFWLPVAEKYEGKDLTEAAFKKIPSSTTMGLTRQEFCSVVGKYAEIVAIPVKEPGGKVVGVLSVDLARKGRDRSQGIALSGNDVEEMLATAAVLIETNR